MREILTLVFKHRLTILGVFLFIVLSVVVVSFLLPPKYEAESVLLVKVGREYLDRREGGTVPSTVDVREITNSEIRILRSRDLMEGVIRTIGLGRIYPDLITSPPKRLPAMDAALKEFSNRMYAYPVKESNVIEIKFRHGDPSIAAEAVNLLVDRFKEKRLELLADSSASFLAEQVAVYRRRLADREEQIEKFKRQHGVFSLSDQRRLLLQQGADLDMSTKNTRSRIVEVAQRASVLRDQMRNVPDTVPLFDESDRSVVIEDAKTRLLGLRLKEQELVSKYQEGSPLIVNVRKDIELVERFLQKQEGERRVRQGRNPVFEQLEAEALRAEAERRSLELKANTIHGQTVVVVDELRALDLLEKELQRLTREMALNESDYRRYADKLEEARIAEVLERERVGTVRVVQRAVAPAEPVTPRKTLNIAVAIVLGAVCSLGVAFLSERLRDAPGTPRVVERELGLPVLAVIPSAWRPGAHAFQEAASGKVAWTAVLTMVSVGRIAVFILGGLLLLGTLTAGVIEMMPGIPRTAVIGATQSQSPPATPAVATTNVTATPLAPPAVRPVARASYSSRMRVKPAHQRTGPQSQLGPRTTTRTPQTSVRDAVVVQRDADDSHAVIDWLLTRSSNR